MIHEVDESLRALFRAGALEGAQVQVAFEAPNREWAAKVNAPTVNVFLYDIREDLFRRERGMRNEYDDEGFVVARRRPPRYFKLSYLITAWTKRAEDEHRLLSSLLACLLGHEALPREHLGGALAEFGAGVWLTVGLPPPQDRSFADVWSALGGELKPSLDLVVSVPVTASPRYEVGPPTGEDGLHLDFSGDAPDHSADDMPASGAATPDGHRLPVYGRPDTAPVQPRPSTTRTGHGPRRGGISRHVSEQPPTGRNGTAPSRRKGDA
ncbi:hypothetical protein N566_15365 [Streptomycetaceae bacterium MP113-05]|nr:hypothetical protein N566_15365 [Streptomycetaceae bacterium MP113-05]